MIKRRTFLLTLLLLYAKFYDENIFSKPFTLSSGQIHKLGRLTRLANEFFYISPVTCTLFYICLNYFRMR